MSRRRVTIPDDLWSRICQYAKDTNRSTSELVCEALEQIMARYPVKRNGPKSTEIDIHALAHEVADILRLRYPQVPSGPSGT
jgi:hypothetical protein